MERRKLTKQDIDKVRHIEGFPIAKDEDIIALSDPPYYTACPNPFIEDFIKEHGKPYDEATDDYHREPFAADVSEGKYHEVYRLHPYHTKVPHEAIRRYIEHYTNTGDIIFEGFCGSGMTGIAAASLVADEEQLSFQKGSKYSTPDTKSRMAIMSDLSPIATFISSLPSMASSINDIANEVENILRNCDEQYGWMFETEHHSSYGITQGNIDFVIWSDVLICPNCGADLIFWETAVNKKEGKIKKEFSCSHCKSKLKKTDCSPAVETYFDEYINEMVTEKRQVPVQINYTANGKKYSKRPDEKDFAVIQKVMNHKIPYWFPTDRMPEGDESRRNDDIGITHVHHYYTRRNLAYLSCFNNYSNTPVLKSFVTRVAFRITKRYALTYMKGSWGAGGGPTPGTLYVPSLMKELPVGRQISSSINSAVQILSKLKQQSGRVIVSTQSSTNLTNIPCNSIDYIFTDPPFGSNIMYSELSFIWEAWLRVFTQDKTEAIVSNTQNKGVGEYKRLLQTCLCEFYRIIKPNRWITVVFHNSKNSIWNSIREAIQSAGFIIADVRTLDKKKGSFVQITATSSVKQDLVISAYKPKDGFVKEFTTKVGNPEGAFDFVRQHLQMLPIVVVKKGKIEVIDERQAYLLFDRMVAYHIVNGLSVPLDASAFYQGLNERFMQRDGMYFLPSQVNEYDTARIINDLEPVQMELLVTNERSAIAWLYQQLDTPQTYGELQPKFMQEQRAIARFEALPELQVLLEENFLQDDKGRTVHLLPPT